MDKLKTLKRGTTNIVRWECICGIFLKEEPQVPGLPNKRFVTLGPCCKDRLKLTYG